MEEALQANADTFRLMAESMPQKIFTARPNGDVDYFNPQWTEFTGLPFEEIRDWGWTQFIHPDDVEENVRLWQRSIETGEPFEFEHRFRRADGTYRWHLSRARPVRDASGRVVMWVGSNTDVDDLRRAHEELRQQAALLALAHEAIIVRDPHGVISFWGEGAAELYGWTADQAVGKVTHDLLQTRILPSGAPGAEMDEILAAMDVWQGDLEHTRRDGTQVVVESRQSLLRASDGTPQAILEVNRDAANREQLARLHRLTAALSAAATVEEVAGVILEEGMAALNAKRGVVAVLSDDHSAFTNVRMVGYPAEVVASWPGFAADESVPLADAVRARESVILESLEERRARYPRLAEGQRASSLGALVAIPLLVGGRAIGGLGLTFATPRQFTPAERALMSTLSELCAQALERARLYEAERRARSEMATILGQIADGVMVIDTAGRTTYLNEAAKSLLGVDTIGVPPERRSEIYGILTAEGAPFRPDELPSMRAMREQQVITGVEMRIRRPDGTEIPVQENAAPIVGEDGTVVGAVATLRDVSAQHELERQKADFLSAIAHDLKNPVTVMQGQTQLLRRRARRGLLEQDQVLEGLAVIEARTRLMTRIIEELMDVTRLRMGQRLQLTPQVVNLVELARDAVEATRSVAEHHRFVVKSDEDEILGFWDATSLARVLGNVLTNAVKYSSEGSDVHIRLRREERRGEPFATVTIQDHGVGIPAADLPHVFDWFYRAGNVADTVSGTGIGLAGARGIVEQHGGTIEVESQEGVGTTVIIRLPLGAGPQARTMYTDGSE